jgi:hypothetical protein
MSGRYHLHSPALSIFLRLRRLAGMIGRCRGPQGSNVTRHFEAGHEFRIAGLAAHLRFCNAMFLIVGRECRPLLLQLLPVLPLGVHALIEADGGFAAGERIRRLTDDAAANLLDVQIGNVIGPRQRGGTEDCKYRNDCRPINTHERHFQAQNGDCLDLDQTKGHEQQRQREQSDAVR